MTPSPEALTWQRRADAWAQQSEVEPYSGGGGQAIEPANRWSDVASTGRPTFPADGTGWRTQTSEWRATGARWRQTTEWRSSTGSHVWRSTTESWEPENNEGEAPPAARPTISGTAWPTPQLESGRESTRDISSSWSETPSWQRDATPPSRPATTPVEQTWSSSSTPSWQQPSAQTPSWQQPAQTPSWQQPPAGQQPPASQPPSWQRQPPQQSSPAPSWQQPRPADSWSSSAQASGSWSTESAAPSGSWDTGRRSPGENTSDVAGWDRSDGPGWQTGPRDDGRHFVREDDRAAWRRADDEWSTRRGRRRAPEPEVQPSGGTGWSTSEPDNWAGHADTGNILAPGSPAPDPGPPAPSWGSRSLRRNNFEAEEPARRGYPAEETSGAYGERSGQIPLQYGVRPTPARRSAPDDGPPGRGAPMDNGTASGGLPQRTRGDSGPSERSRIDIGQPDRSRVDIGQPDRSRIDIGQPERSRDDAGPPDRSRGDAPRARGPRRYNANPTNWRESTSAWEAEPDTSNWTRDPDTGQWSRGEEDPRVLAWRAEAARREQMRQGGDEAPANQPGSPAAWTDGRRGRREDEPTGPVGGVPGGPLPASGMPDAPGVRQRSAMPAPRSAMPSQSGPMPSQGSGGWSNGGAMPSPATPRGAAPGGAPWNGADQPDPSMSGRFRAEQQYESGPYPAQRGAPDSYGNNDGGRRRAPEAEAEAWSGRQARREDDYPAEGWRQGPTPPRQRELPAGRSEWSEPGYAAQRELPAGRSTWPEEREPRQNGYGEPEPDNWSERGPRQNGYGGPDPRQGGYGSPDPRQGGYGAPEPGYDGSSWSDTRRVNGARELPAGGPSREPAYGGMRELPAAPPRRDDGYGEPARRDPRKPAYGGQRELPSGPTNWSEQEPPQAFEEETDRYGNPRRRDDRDEPPFGGGGPGVSGQGDWQAPGSYTDAPRNGGTAPVNGWNGAGEQGSGSYRRGVSPEAPGSGGPGPGPGGDWRAELNGGGAAAPVSGVAGYRAGVAADGGWRADMNGGGTVTSAAPVSGYRATATPGGDWRADLNGAVAPAAGLNGAATSTPGLNDAAAPTAGLNGAAAVTTAAPPAADWRAELNGSASGSGSAGYRSGTAPVSGAAGYRPADGTDWRTDLNGGSPTAPTSGAAGYRATAGADWRTDMSGTQTSATAPVSGATGYRATTTPAPAADDWRRELARDAAPADGEPQRFSTSNFPQFQPSGSAPVGGESNLALSATSVIATPPASGEDTSWPPRRGVSSALFENTGSYERRPVSSGVLSGRQNDPLAADDEDEPEKSNSPLAAVGYTVAWYGVPVVLFVLGILLLNSGQRAHALQTLANAAPEFGISLGLSIVVAFGLRFATTAWKSASVGLAAAVVGGGLATVLSSAITGNSLS